jgi:NADP-dependent 3-hydroxy acid dehydrogenase YdfG
LALGSDPLQDGKLDNWNTMIDTNIKGLLYVTHAVLPTMIANNSGHIVNISSIAGIEHYPGGNVYSATKHAVRALSKSLRIDLSGYNIRVSDIAPGSTHTEFSKVRWNDKERSDKFYGGFTPLTAEDIADTILFCVSRKPHVNVESLVVYPTVQASATSLSLNK